MRRNHQAPYAGGVYEFTSRQIVAIIAMVAVASVLLPIGVRAATGSAVNVTDPLNAGSQARVHGNGSLRTTLTDPTAAAYAKVDGTSLRIGPPTVSNALQAFSTLTGTTTFGVLTAGVFEAGQTAGVGSLTIGNTGTTDVNLRIAIAEGQTFSCTGSLTGFFTVMIIPSPAGQTLHLSFPVPLQSSRPAKWCFRGNLDSAPAGTSVIVAAVGYKL